MLSNPLLAYILVFLVMPLVDARWLGTPDAASLLFALCGIGIIFIVLLVRHRKRWILKL
jgi:hypothetical protein